MEQVLLMYGLSCSSTEAEAFTVRSGLSIAARWIMNLKMHKQIGGYLCPH